MTVGFVAGAFDLLHVGHIHLLRQCKSYCDLLVVALQVDPNVDRPEKNKPVESLAERFIKLTSIKYVNSVVVYETEDDLVLLLKTINPDVRFLGTDYKESGKPITKPNLVPIRYIESLPIHTTDIRKRIKK